MATFYLILFICSIVLGVFNVIKMIGEESIVEMTNKLWYSLAYFTIASVTFVFWYAS